MNYRLSQIQSQTTLTDDKTDTYDINIIDPISRITIQLKGTNADSTPDGHPAKAISKVELVDGSDVLYSLSGEEAQATDFYDSGVSPLNVVAYEQALQWACLINMNFGRKLWDTELALDPTKFKNLQLKITHKVADTAGSSTTSTTSHITIWAHVFDEKKITPRGFLMSKEQKAYVIGAEGSYEYTELPTDYPMRRLMIQALYVGYEVHQIVNEFKLSEDHDKRTVYNDKVSNYMKVVCPEYGRYHETIVPYPGTGTVAHYTAVGYEYCVSHIGTTDADTTIQLTAYPLGGRLYLTAVANQACILDVEGYAPHGCIPIFLGQQDDIADWYDVTRIGSLMMRTKAGSLAGTATARIITQQFRTY